MALLDQLERRFGRFSIPGLTLILVVGQVIVWLAMHEGLTSPMALGLWPAAVLAGQWWRVLTFVFVPPIATWWVIFAWWIFYFMGTALEGFWGAFRYTLYLFSGYALTVAAGFIFPEWPVSNAFLATSVLLAFAYIEPNYQLSLFFIIPVAVKWFALLAWVWYLIEFVQGPWATRVQVLAAVGNFVLFFGRDAWQTAGLRMRHMRGEAARLAPRGRREARHVCRICGKTDLTNPEMDFRYCSRCAGEQCYCPEHIFNHVHVTEEAAGPEKA